MSTSERPVSDNGYVKPIFLTSSNPSQRIVDSEIDKRRLHRRSVPFGRRSRWRREVRAFQRLHRERASSPGKSYFGLRREACDQQLGLDRWPEDQAIKACDAVRRSAREERWGIRVS